VLVVGVDIGVQRSRIDEESYGATSARRISSIRSEMSEWPLRPEAAAISRRFPIGPPRCASIASRVSSETVVEFVGQLRGGSFHGMPAHPEPRATPTPFRSEVSLFQVADELL
jgi:hypothetical protein